MSEKIEKGEYEKNGLKKDGLGNEVDINRCYVYRVTIHEGRFHQVKRMFEAVGKHVIFLKRLSMGTLLLDESLQKGSYRRLTDEEIAELKK